MQGYICWGEARKQLFRAFRTAIQLGLCKLLHFHGQCIMRYLMVYIFILFNTRAYINNTYITYNTYRTKKHGFMRFQAKKLLHFHGQITTFSRSNYYIFTV